MASSRVGHAKIKSIGTVDYGQPSLEYSHTRQISSYHAASSGQQRSSSKDHAKGSLDINQSGTATVQHRGSRHRESQDSQIFAVAISGQSD